MQRQPPLDQGLVDLRARGEQRLRGVRILTAFTIAVLTGHLEYLVFPAAVAAGGLTFFLLLAYPVVFGALALSGLWLRVRGALEVNVRSGAIAAGFHGYDEP